MPCWDHDIVNSPPTGGLFASWPQQAMIHGLFPLRGVPLKLPASLRSKVSLRPCRFRSFSCTEWPFFLFPCEFRAFSRTGELFRGKGEFRSGAL